MVHLYGPGGINPSSRPLDVACTQLGVYEEGRNRGPQVDVYVAFAGRNPDDECPWCCAFVVWCCWQAGVEVRKTASCKRFTLLNADRRIAEPEVGCIGVHLKPDGRGHIVFIEGLGNRLSTVEGNTNAAGSREGDRVARQVRAQAYFNGGFFSV